MKRKESLRRILALLLAVCLLVGVAPMAFAAESDGADEWIVEAEELPGSRGTVATGREPLVEPLYDDDEIVTVMVQVDAPALLDYYNTAAVTISADASAGQSVSEFISGMVESGAAEELEAQQASVLEAVAALSPSPYALMTASAASSAASNLQVVGQWTTLVNAFAVRVPYGQLDAIRSIEGVRTAYVAKTYERPAPVEPDADAVTTDAGWAGYSYDMVGLNEAWNAGYTGKGMLVAVLDTGLDLELSAFYDPNTNENTEDGLPGDNVYAIRRTHEAFRENSFKSLKELTSGTNFLATRYNSKEAAVATINSLKDALHATTLGITIGADVIYKNRKVPFAFDYSTVVEDDDGNWAVVGDPNVYPGDEGETHGTHVAGTIAGYVEDTDGKVKFSGAAPDAQLLIMKIFPDDGGGAQDPAILYALEDAVTLGADMINMSLGSDHGFADDDSLAKAAYHKASETGITMMTSAGNSGYSGANNNINDTYYPSSNPDMSMMSSPAVYSTNLSVASINNTVEAVTELTWLEKSGDEWSGNLSYNEHTISYYDPNSVAMKGKFTQEYIDKVGQVLRINGEEVHGIPIINAGYGRASYTNQYNQVVSDYDAFWSESNSGGYTGIALVMRGMPEGSDQTLSFADKVNNAMAHSGFDADGNPKGVLAVILYDPKDTSDAMLYVSVDGAGMTSISISGAAGAALAASSQYSYDIRAYLSSVKQEDSIVQSDSGQQMSSFSSWGSGPALELKPEITAPGGNIWSSVLDMTYEPHEGYYNDYTGTYGMMSGTSMAAPHMAGLGAVVKQYVEDKHSNIAATNAAQAKLVSQLLMSTAVPQKPAGSDVYYSPRQQGAGLVNVGAAVSTPAYISVDGQSVGKIELGDMLEGKFDLKFSVNNMTAQAQSYTAQVVVMRPDTYTGQNQAGKTYILTKDTDIVIDASVTGNTAITVNPNGKTDVTLTVDISGALAEINSLFPNGAFIEGYIILTPADTSSSVQIGLPFLGFEGDWTKAPILDSVTWLDGCTKDEETPEGGWKLDSTSVWDSNGENTYRYTWFPSLMGFYNGSDFINLGQNVFDSKAPTGQTTYHKENIALSPTGTSLNSFLYINDIELYQIRDARAIIVEVRDKTSNELYWRDGIACMPRSGYDSGYAAVIPYSVYSFPIWDGTDMDGTYLPNDTECVYTIMAFGDGDYKSIDEAGYIDIASIDLTNKATWPTFNGHDMDTSGDSMSFPVLIDTEAPTLVDNAVSLKKEGDKVFMTLTVKDNGSLASIEVIPEVTRTPRPEYGAEGGPETRADDANPFVSDMIYDPALKTKTITVDVTDYVRTNTDSRDYAYTYEWTGAVYLYSLFRYQDNSYYADI